MHVWLEWLAPFGSVHGTAAFSLRIGIPSEFSRAAPSSPSERRQARITLGLRPAIPGVATTGSVRALRTRNGFGIHNRCSLAKSQSFPVLDRWQGREGLHSV